MLRRLVAALCGAGLLAGAAASPAVALTAAQEAAVPPLQARLHVANRHPLQLHGVLFDASHSTGPIVRYDFHYGDGIYDSSYQPLALHGYDKPGNYRAFIVVVTADGRQSVSSPIWVHVRDGIPPVVRIDSPRANQTLRLGRSGAQLSGRASDAGGVAKVQLAMQLVSSRQHFNTGGACIWYDGHQWLVLSGCDAPYFFDARVRHGRWSFRIPGSARIPKGTYVVRVRGIDRAGNISHYYALSLRTILPFKLG